MFSLIITIICMVLVAALALATIHYGGWERYSGLRERGKPKGPAPRGKQYWYMR